MTIIEPCSLADALRAEASSVQEKWFSQLYFLKALVFGVIALFWKTTGLVSFGPGWKIGMDLMREGGVEDIGPLLIAAGASPDIIIGIGIAFHSYWICVRRRPSLPACRKTNFNMCS